MLVAVLKPGEATVNHQDEHGFKALHSRLEIVRKRVSAYSYRSRFFVRV
jgi:hypothetical protein